MKKITAVLALSPFLVSGAFADALTPAGITTDVTAVATDASTLFSTVEPIALAIVSLGILIFVLRKLRRS